MFGLKRKPLSMPSPETALPGRPDAITTAATHFVNGAPLKGPYPQGSEIAIFGLGGGGIRTLETVTRLHTFQACAFDHSATPPQAAKNEAAL